MAFFALSRGLYGNNSAAASAESNASVAILADDDALDIPLVRREGELAARFWQEAGTTAEYPTSWPDSVERALRFLHVAGHGRLQPGLAGSKHSIILQGENYIGESEILRAPRTREALVNICVAGQSHDNPLNGNPVGIVPGFLRLGTDWVVASLVALPDTWALLAGLILIDLRSSSDAALPELLDEARTRLTHGGWPHRVSAAFADALIADTRDPATAQIEHPKVSSRCVSPCEMASTVTFLICVNSKQWTILEINY